MRLVVREGTYSQAVGGGVGVASRKFMDDYAKGIHGKESKSKQKTHKEGKEEGHVLCVPDSREEAKWFISLSPRCR